ncbi:MAG: type II toxin-antitoxin system VapC family toxin [Planctomycetes bacterium]|nr:type II toxin-antitoxin system VapC family toxin [Planctomycetota bacterium]
MSLYIIDTDHLTLYRYGHPQVTARIEATPPEQLAITIISIEEQLTGWYAQIRRSRDLEKLERAYQGLFQVIESATRIRVIPFSRQAMERYLGLRKQLPRLGKLDLSIAAIVLEHKAILVTRNRKDFERIPGLTLENWSQ